eukprot:13262996-Ditylum_brightwellii.AAC.1
MDAANYATRTGGIAYVASSQHPGAYDPNIAANSGYEALPKWLLSKIEDHDTRLNTISLQDIFDHAYDRSGQIDNDLVGEYTNNFNAPINMTQGFNTYVECQEECRDFFSDLQQSITNQQLVSHLINKIGRHILQAL